MFARKRILVFGSNKAGRHGKGAALHAVQYCGAIYGQGEGRQGDSYAIPTKDGNLQPLSLDRITIGVARFIIYAINHPDLDFRITAIGCGLAGYSPREIAPMFARAPKNCLLPQRFKQMPIDSFDGKYRFLSNFYPHTVLLNDIAYPSNEHAYQAAKTRNHEQREQIRLASTPNKAKRLGQAVDLRSDWEDIKLRVMRTLVRRKFTNKMLQKQLLETAPVELIEGNSWGDKYWGVCRGVGENHLGIILMQCRDFYSKDTDDA